MTDTNSRDGTAGRQRLAATDRRDQILLAARTLFADKPYELVSTGDVATAAGTTRTNVLYHFSSKRDLFVAVVECFAVTEPIRLPDNTRGDSSAVVLDDWLAMVERNSQVMVAMLRARSSTDPVVAGLLTQSMRVWEEPLLSVAGLDIDDAAHRAQIRGYQALITELVLAWLVEGTLTRAQVHRTLVGTLEAIGAAGSSS